jgi:hypothetical protein
MMTTMKMQVKSLLAASKIKQKLQAASSSEKCISKTKLIKMQLVHKNVTNLLQNKLKRVSELLLIHS